MIIKEIETKDYLTKSNLPSSDYVINPYVGCPHGCKYCYASFMKRFTNHPEPWGDFIDIKRCSKIIDTRKLIGKRVFMSSVTDCYNPYEEKYCLTRHILKELINVDCYLDISTKSSLILRDIDILKELSHVTVASSINTLDESFKNDMDNASSIKERLNTLKTLHENGIRTVLFMSPIFPYITDFKSIIEKSKDYIDEYWFENLNLRGDYKQIILKYIKEKYPNYYQGYYQIYVLNNASYWDNLAIEIEKYCVSNNIKFQNFFHHNELVRNKKRG